VKIFILKMQRWWASLHGDHLKALAIARRIKLEVDHIMALNTDAWNAAIQAAQAKLSQESAALAQAQADLASSQGAEAAAQAVIDAGTASLTAAIGQ